MPNSEDVDCPRVIQAFTERSDNYRCHEYYECSAMILESDLTQTVECNFHVAVVTNDLTK